MSSNSPFLSEELLSMQREIRRFVTEQVQPRADEWERDGAVPRDVLRAMGTAGFFSLRVPSEEGGLGLGPLGSVAFAEALATSTYGGFDITVLVHTDMASPHIIASGTPDQRARYVPGILSGEAITAIAVTEPDAGSDVAQLRTRAEPKDGGYLLNGTKLYITNGALGDVVVVAARTDPAHRYGISTFLVDRGTPGLHVARKLDKTGWLSSDTAELVFDDCWVASDQLLGTEHRGFYEIMRNFQNERLVLAAMAVGQSQTALDLAVRWTRARHVFGKALYEQGSVRQRLAMLQAKVDAARAGLYHAAWLLEHASPDSVRAVSGSKAFACELVNEVMYTCVQFHGGLGYMRESAIERMSRDARVLSIGGGATEVMLEEIAKRTA